jgi:hypothetical protein
VCCRAPSRAGRDALWPSPCVAIALHLYLERCLQCERAVVLDNAGGLVIARRPAARGWLPYEHHHLSLAPVQRRGCAARDYSFVGPADRKRLNVFRLPTNKPHKCDQRRCDPSRWRQGRILYGGHRHRTPSKPGIKHRPWFVSQLLPDGCGPEYLRSSTGPLRSSIREWIHDLAVPAQGEV